jgi:signal transduction histidine kinase/ActR/RegA family two-component response regulator
LKPHPIGQLKSRLRLFVGLILVGVVGFSVWTVLTERNIALSRAEMRAAGYARALAGHSESAFAESDRVLKDILKDISRAGGYRRLDPRRMHELLREESEGAPQVGSVFVADRAGHMLANSLQYPQKPVDVGDRDYFRHYLQVPGADLTIGRPVVSRLVGRWRFNLMRPLNRPGEPFDGLAAVAFEVDYFKRFFDAGSLGPRGRLLLVREDGAPLVYEPYADNAYQSDLRGSRLFRNMRASMSSGTYRVERSVLDGTPRIVSYMRLSRFPVVAVVGLHMEDELAPWRRRALLQGLVTLAMVLLVLLLTSIMFRHLDRLREAQDTLAAQREAQARLEDQLRHIQKIEAIGQLAGGIAHDFNNLLTPIIVSAELARRAVRPGDPIDGRFDSILSAAHKAKELTQKLLSFARRQMMAMVPVDLDRVIADFREILRRTIREDIAIEFRPGAGGAVFRGDQGQIEQVLVNLAINAQDAIEGPGRIAFETGRETVTEEAAKAHPGMRPGPYIRLTVSDDGCGMEPEVLRHVFEPFFTTKPVGQGTGLGLATVYGIVKQHEGYVGVESRPGAGTTFTIFLPDRGPLEEPEPRDAGADARAETFADGKGDILVAEDNEMVRTLIVGMLESFGYRVRATGSPGEALAIACDRGNPIDLLVSDLVMPEMGGRQLAERIREARPALPVLFISGYASGGEVPEESPEEGIRFIKKPFTLDDFIAGVQASLEKR